MILPDAPELLLFMSVGFALNITPGPDMMFVAGRSVAEGRRSGVASALGVGVGTLFHIALVAFGLASLATTRPAAFAFIRLVGAGYLVHLGVQALRARAVDDAPTATRQGGGAAFRQGVTTNVLNPKVAMFFLAFLPQFVDPARGTPAIQVIVLGLIFDVVGTIVNVVVALVASRLSQSMRRSGRARVLLERACGILFIGLGIRLAISAKA